MNEVDKMKKAAEKLSAAKGVAEGKRYEKSLRAVTVELEKLAFANDAYVFYTAVSMMRQDIYKGLMMLAGPNGPVKNILTIDKVTNECIADILVGKR